MERTHEGRAVRVRGLVIAGRNGSLAFGLILITVGVALWLEQQNLIPEGFWRNGWPWIIVLLASIQIVTARTANRFGDGVSFTLLGLWLVAVQSHWHGLTWRNSWPLSLAAMGSGIVAHAIAGLFMPDTPRTLVRERRGEPSDV